MIVLLDVDFSILCTAHNVKHVLRVDAELTEIKKFQRGIRVKEENIVNFEENWFFMPSKYEADLFYQVYYDYKMSTNYVAICTMEIHGNRDRKNNNSMQCAFVTMAKVNQFENKNNIQYQFA